MLMSELPSGTITFLLTDVEGSTRLWEQHPDEMREALARHDALIDEAVASHRGHVVRPRGEGDSRFAVFPFATDAVVASPLPGTTAYSRQLSQFLGCLKLSPEDGARVGEAMRKWISRHRSRALMRLTGTST